MTAQLDLIAEGAKLLYGNRWQVGLAEMTGMSLDLVSMWFAAPTSARYRSVSDPEGVLAAIRAACRQRSAELTAWADRHDVAA